jgi:hypothetical protein
MALNPSQLDASAAVANLAMASPASGGQAATAAPKPILQLADLRGLRTAPPLSELERQSLQAELLTLVASCPWFTVGVMAPTAAAAITALRRCEAAFGWDPLAAADGADDAIEGPVFLKGNQRTGSYLLRREEGLGEGLLISGQNPDNPALADTWGPLPLDWP